MQNSKTDIAHSLHARPLDEAARLFLHYLGFKKSECTYALGDVCLAAELPTSITFEKFIECFKEALASFRVAHGKVGEFLNPHRAFRDADTDGHTAPQPKFVKGVDEAGFRFALTWIESARASGWVQHIHVPTDLPFDTERLLTDILHLGTFEACPAFGFEPCFWTFTRQDAEMDVFAAQFMHESIDRLRSAFAPGLSALAAAEAAMKPAGLSFELSLVPTLKRLLKTAEVIANRPAPKPKTPPQPTSDAREPGVTPTQRSGEATTHPKVFVSHASEDKERFVLGFATRLRERGIDAWVDRWEMLPGDKLVEKIFQEGIRSAAAMIVVLSKFSCAKPWVREEMDAGFVKRVNQGSKLIPVVIEPCDVPEVLKTTLWETIDDLGNYGSALDRIVSAVTGVHHKPPLGPPPKSLQLLTDVVAGLTPADTLVLRLLCEKVMSSGERLIFFPELTGEAKKAGLSENDLEEVLEILNGRGYIKGGHDGDPNFEVTDYGFREYLQHFVPDFESMHGRICFAILNEGLTENRPMAETLAIPLAIVDHVLDDLNTRDLVEVSSLMGCGKSVESVSAKFRRRLKR